MTDNFLERNRRKSALAALLLLLRERKALVVLLLLVVGASTLFLAPSSFLVDLPGGSRMAATVAWVASRVGVDVTRWGLTGGRVSFGDLLLAFGSARSTSRAGWGPFFNSPTDKNANGAGSLDFVKASRADLADGNGANRRGRGGAGGGGSGPFQQVIDPAQAAQDDGAVAVGPGDVGGAREGFLQTAFAGGFFNGILGGAGGADAGANSLSGGAYAGAGFFGGAAGVPSSAGAAAKSGLSNLPYVGTPAAQLQGRIAGRISSAFASALKVREIQGVAGATVLNSTYAYTQLAEGNAQAQIATVDCTPPNCPGEVAATNTGAIYDGNSVGNANHNGLITATPVDGSISPTVPNASVASGALQSAEQMNKDAETCQALDAQYGPQEDAANAQMQALSQQFSANSCGGSGGCGGNAQTCQNIGNAMKAACANYMSLRCAHTRACPLTANDAAATCSSECQQGANTSATQIQPGLQIDGGTTQ